MSRNKKRSPKRRIRWVPDRPEYGPDDETPEGSRARQRAPPPSRRPVQSEVERRIHEIVEELLEEKEK